jgi:hypothetical protein
MLAVSLKEESCDELIVILLHALLKDMGEGFDGLHIRFLYRA